MNRLSWGSLAIILGGLALSFQLYGLKLIQGLEMIKGSWRTDAMAYAEEEPIKLALWITVAVICYGIWLIFDSYRKRKETGDK